MATLPLLTLHGPRNATDAQALLRDDDIRARVFFVSGIIIPPMTYRPDSTVDPARWEVRMNGDAVASGERGTALDMEFPAILAVALRMKLAPFVTPLLVDQYLNQLEGFPDLVKTVRETLTVAELADHLQRRVATGASIRNFRGALEDILQSLTTTAPTVH